MSFFKFRKSEPQNSAAETAPSGAPTRPEATRNFAEFFYWLKTTMNYQPEVCIDVGAACGTPAIYRAFPNARHYIFEPVKSLIPELREAVKNYDAEIFEIALMEKPGEEMITLTANQYGSTMIARGKKPPQRKQQKVKVSTLDIELLERVKGKKTLLKTDCQGGDLSVIKGGEKLLHHCDVVIMETSLYRFWGAHHPDFYDIVHYMKQRGFVVFDILDGLFRPSNDALAQVDLVFALENGCLRPHHRW